MAKQNNNTKKANGPLVRGILEGTDEIIRSLQRKKRLKSRFVKMKALGLEPKTHGLKGRCSENVTTDITMDYESEGKSLSCSFTDFAQHDDALDRLITLWPSLPEAVKDRIMELAGDATTD